MNYGYNRATPGYVRRRQARLAAALGALCARADFADADGMHPYVEVDGLYEGVRIRRMTHLTGAQQDELLRWADEIYDRVMGNG
jgi:hypothetical protein